MTDVFKSKTGMPLNSWARIGTNQTLAIDVQNEAVAAIFTQPEDATITTVGFLNGTVTGTATSITDDTYTISIQGVTTGGVPDGTILGGGTPASATFPQTGQAGGVTLGSATSHVITLANTIALQGGTQYALVIQHTGASDLTNFINPRYGASPGGFANDYPYTATADATPTWTKQTHCPFYWFIRSASKTYGFPGISFVVNQNFGTTTESGGSFTFPSGLGTSNSVGVRGIRFLCGSTGCAAGNTYMLTLYSGTGGANPTILQQTAQLDSDIMGATSANREAEILFPEDSMTALTPGTKYGIGFSCSGASGWSFETITLPAAGDRSAYPQPQLTFMTRTLASAYPPDASDGAFAETTTTILNAELIIGDFTAASAGGGLRLAGHGGLAA